jgi:hypothetical protein
LAWQLVKFFYANGCYIYTDKEIKVEYIMMGCLLVVRHLSV